MADVEDLPATKTIPIQPPIAFGGETYSELVLREPTVAEVEAVDGRTGVRWTRELAGAVAAVPRDVMLKLGIRTLNSCSDYLTRFTDAGLPTATNS